MCRRRLGVLLVGMTVAMFLAAGLEAARRKELGDAAARNDRATMRQLKETRRQLGLVQDHLRNEQTNLESQHASLNDLLGRLEQQRVILDQRVAAANAALKRAREI